MTPAELRAARKRLGMTQAQLARALKIRSDRTIRRMEADDGEVPGPVEVAVTLMQRLPLQPLYVDEHGTVRFKANAIVRFLLEAGPFDVNQLALMTFTSEDREQFAQLIGYSLSGFGELDYVSDEAYEAAAVVADRLETAGANQLGDDDAL